jgi:uncharacterized repeat protein (TIGR03899 family)
MNNAFSHHNIAHTNELSSIRDNGKTRDLIQDWFYQAGVLSKQSDLSNTETEDKLVFRQRQRDLLEINNLEKISRYASKYSQDKLIRNQLDADWFYGFLALAGQVHGAKMQELWGKILATEITHPSSFSLNSLQTLKTLTFRDAQAFRQAASLASKRTNNTLPVIIIGYRQSGTFSWLKQKRKQLNLAEFGLNYPELLQLIDLKLIYANPIENNQSGSHAGSFWQYHNHQLQLKHSQKVTTLHYYKFTHTGVELLQLFQGKENKHYYTALVQMLTETNLCTDSTLK